MQRVFLGQFLRAFGSAANGNSSLTLSACVIDLEGRMIPLSIQSRNAGYPQEITIGLPDGYLASASLIENGTATIGGANELYGAIELWQGVNTTSGVRLGVLARGHFDVSSGLGLGMFSPWSPDSQSVQSIGVGNPAAGSDFTSAMGGSLGFRVAAVTWRLVTDANVANRQARLSVLDNLGTLVGTWLAAALQTASQTRDVCFSSQSGPEVSSNTIICSPTGIIAVPPNGSIRTNYVSLQAGDQISNVRILATPGSPN